MACARQASGDAPCRIAFVVNHVAFFVSHRFPLAREALRRGWATWLYTGQAGSDSMEAEAMGALATSQVRHVRLGFGSSTLNPIRELFALLKMTFQMRTTRPDIVHCASPKGLLYGGIAARLSGVPALVLAVSGMGYVFTDANADGWRRRLLRTIYTRMVHFVFTHGNKRVIVQNLDDRRWFLDQGLVSEHEVVLIPGSGVGQEFYEAGKGVSRQPMVVFPARMLADKGLEDFIAAVREIKPRLPGWRFILAGAADYKNPSSVGASRIQGWVREGLVEWLGHVSNMPALFSEAAIICLPSHREGMPKVLLEAAAASCAVVTTDTIGCREAIIPGKTGDLVPVRDPISLGAALLALALDEDRRESYGRSARILAEQRFGLDAVVSEVFRCYSELKCGSRER